MSLQGENIPQTIQNSHGDCDEGPPPPAPQMLQVQQNQFGGYPPQPGLALPLHPDVMNPQPIENNQHMVS